MSSKVLFISQKHSPLKNQGFTLIEVMIVVGILGIIGAIAVPVYRNYITTSKQQSARAVLEQFPILLETYRAENGSMSPDCNGTVNCNHTYYYSEGNSGAQDTVGDKITDNYPDFKAKSTTGQTASLYDYSVTVTVAGCPATCTETAQATATPDTSRDAPTGNIVGDSF